VVSKTALVRLTETLALEAAPHGIRMFRGAAGSAVFDYADVTTQPVRLGIRGAPAKTLSRAASTGSPCLRSVET